MAYIFNERFILALWILALIYLAYRLFNSRMNDSKKKQKIALNLDRYDDIVSSDKYKVKGQYDN